MGAVPYDLTVDSGGDQFTVTGPTPRLSWKISADTTAALRTRGAHRRRARSPPGLTTEPPVRRLAVEALRSGQRVQWRVRTSRSLAADWSEWAAFEVGLLHDDWTASWISPVESADPGYGQRPAHLLATEFALTGRCASARLYATALGVYTAAVNGERAGTAELSPGSTSYDRTLYAQASDVTVLADAGTRTGSRSNCPTAGTAARSARSGCRPAGERCSVRVRNCTSSTPTERVRSSAATSTWTSTPSTTIRADLMDGQTVDFTAGPRRHRRQCSWTRSRPRRSTGRLRRRCGSSSLVPPQSLREVRAGRVGRRLRPERVRAGSG